MNRTLESDVHLKRLAGLRGEIERRELDALLITNPENVKYLSGFTGTNGTLIVDADQATLLTDFRYVEQAAEQAPAVAVLDGRSEPRKALVGRLGSASRVGFDDADMRVKSFRQLEEELEEDRELVAASGAVESLREIKDPQEIDAIARAALIGDTIYAALAESGLAGRKETEVARQIEQVALEHGASGLSFPPIVASGPRGALPHAEPQDVVIERGTLVVLDLGVKYGGYCSDCTRTFATGSIPDSWREVYDFVLESQLAALAAVEPGAECSRLDAIAREVIEGGGHGDRFGHALGHGVGIEVHEGPVLASRSKETLAAGNVITVEPGIYVPGEFGVRIEDLVAVTEDGSRVLTPFDKRLTTVD